MDDYSRNFVRRTKAKAITNDKGCWLIQSPLDKDGYFIGSFHGKSVRAHRKIYEIVMGKILKGLVIDHLCKNRNCCNSEHLEVVTVKINTNRGKNFRSSKTHCIHGHEFTSQNTYIAKNGSRHCQICRTVTIKKYAEGGYFYR